LSTTVVQIHGKERLEGVTIAQVDDKRRPIEETKRYIPCDTLLLSVGLIPENELTRAAGIPPDPVTNGAIVDENCQTKVPGIFACGNVLQVHDLVDYVSKEAEAAGKNAARYILEGKKEGAQTVQILAEGGVRYTVPSYIRPAEMEEKLTVRFRVGDVYKNCAIVTYFGDKQISKRKRPVMAPGEMEQVVLQRKELLGYPDLKQITIRIEEV